MRARHGTRAALVDDVARGEALEREGFVERMRRVIGDRMGEDPSRARRRLEAAITPSAIDIEVAERRLADDGAAIHGQVHDAAPVAPAAQPAEARKEHDE